MTSKTPSRCIQTVSSNYVRALFGAALLAGALSGSVARADLVVPPPPDCVGKPDGSFCQLGDGTAGKCLTIQDPRRPGRSSITCQKDAAECDRLAIGAECHGYLGKPAHCKEFSDPEKQKTWRTCQLDEHNADAPKPEATPTPAAPRPDTAMKQTTAEKTRWLSCSAAPGATSAAGAAPLALGLLAGLGRRRRRKE